MCTSANPDVTRFDGYTRFGGADSGEEVGMPKKSIRSGYSEEFKVEASQLVCSPPEKSICQLTSDMMSRLVSN